jgi:sigma-54 dependent transcriptional regulator, flagellar regulatory protein
LHNRIHAGRRRRLSPTGSAKIIHVDARIIVATHRDLPALIRDGTFREDFFYRLNVFPIETPPPRERERIFGCLFTILFPSCHDG